MRKIISWFLRNIPRKTLQLFSHWVLKVIAVFYAGNKVECTVCNKRFRKFVPYGRDGRVARANALCPNCLALERHRLLWLYLQEKTDFFTAEHKLLHIAPEICFMERFEAMPNLDYITGDIESPLAKVKMDIHEIPFEDASFDICFCNHVMEHVADDIKAMGEIKRVLRPGGWAIIQIPLFLPIPEKTIEDPAITDPKERERVYGQDDHVRMYGLDYADRLRRAGFKVTEDKFVLDLPKEVVARHAFQLEEVIFFCQKEA